MLGGALFDGEVVLINADVAGAKNNADSDADDGDADAADVAATAAAVDADDVDDDAEDDAEDDDDDDDDDENENNDADPNDDDDAKPKDDGWCGCGGGGGGGSGRGRGCCGGLLPASTHFWRQVQVLIRDATSSCLLMVAHSSAVRSVVLIPPLKCEWPFMAGSAPWLRSSSTVALCPVKAASSKGVKPPLSARFTCAFFFSTSHSMILVRSAFFGKGCSIARFSSGLRSMMIGLW